MLEACGGWPAGLRWLQATNVGVDRIAAAQPPDAVIVTNMRGRFDQAIAEWVFSWMLMHTKLLPSYLTAHNSRHWVGAGDSGDQLRPQNLAGQTIGIVGVGSIGGAMAKMYSTFGMEVLATSRSAATDAAPPEFVDELFPLSELHALLARSAAIRLQAALSFSEPPALFSLKTSSEIERVPAN